MSASSFWKRHKNAEHDTKNIRSVILIHFSYIISTFGIKRCKILCFMKHFYQSFESRRMRELWNTVNVWITCRVWHYDASNSSNGTPVVEWKANRTITMTPFEGLDLPNIIIVDLRICFIHLFCSEFWNVFVFVLMISYIRTIKMNKNS